ncbi:ceramidase domain-containing protein [Ketobacter sp.]|uniref:ceramidase domain-containing protein n=1 Tax=Ketobacter sp. TaxID=2083498 RepID=UPI000F14F4B7|nr:ceramidase domain-containing protein [Ketobacter sp.]RLT99342.1 MAG: hypothetical protein D9N14_08155 [Ketobacter sp.]
MFESIDNYCERVGAAFWAEPLNAVTNLAFILAAWLAWNMMQRLSAQSTGHRFLIAVLFSIGVGSFLFHTFATGWAELADIIPILVFQTAFLWLYSREVIQLGRPWAGLLMVAFFVLVVAGFQLKTLLGLSPDSPSPANGSEMYAGALVGVFTLALYHLLTDRVGRFTLLGAFALFCLSLGFRTLDMAFCSVWPVGTHFLWHLCNAAVLYLSIRALLLNSSGEPLPGEEYQRRVSA